MELYYHDVDRDVLILSADGGLLAQNAEQFVDDLDRFIELGCRKLLVDCSRLTRITSFGLGVLVTLHKRLARNGGDVKLAAVQGVVLRVISHTALGRVFEIYPTVDDARAAFHSAGGSGRHG